MGYGLEETGTTTTPTKAPPTAGEVVEIPSVGACEVLPGDDPSLIYLKTPTGAVLKVGDNALRDLVALDPAERLRMEEQGHD